MPVTLSILGHFLNCDLSTPCPLSVDGSEVFDAAPEFATAMAIVGKPTSLEPAELDAAAMRAGVGVADGTIPVGLVDAALARVFSDLQSFGGAADAAAYN